MALFDLLFGRTPRMSLDSLEPLSEAAGQSGGLDNIVNRRKQNFLEVRLALEKGLNRRVTSRAYANAAILIPSAGVTDKRGSLV